MGTKPCPRDFLLLCSLWSPLFLDAPCLPWNNSQTIKTLNTKESIRNPWNSCCNFCCSDCGWRFDKEWCEIRHILWHFSQASWRIHKIATGLQYFGALRKYWKALTTILCNWTLSRTHTMYWWKIWRKTLCLLTPWSLSKRFYTSFCTWEEVLSNYVRMYFYLHAQDSIWLNPGIWIPQVHFCGIPSISMTLEA